jgi:hypothetical protein
MRRHGLPAFAAAVLFACALTPAGDAPAQVSEPRNMSFEEPAPAGGAPPGWWYIQHAGPTSFEFAIDDQGPKTGQRSLRIKRTGAEPFGLVFQFVNADRYRGKRVRLTARLRLDKVEVFGSGSLADISGAGLMLRSQGGAENALDDMRDRPLRGTKGWTEARVEIDVPATANRVEFGAQLTGTGTLWATAFKLEVVEPATDARAAPSGRAAKAATPPGP